ncbi:MAG: hypothetical protein L0241_24200 [Planctomycetia bacterium]|nr:hypothetical protein [Planctomycetia bacterium]
MPEPDPNDPAEKEKTLKTITEVLLTANGAELKRLSARLTRPGGREGFFNAPDPYGPTPRFTEPDIPCVRTLTFVRTNGLQIKLKANRFWAHNYRLRMFRINLAGMPTLHLFTLVGGADPNNLLIDGGGGSSTYVIQNTSFPADGVGVYLLKIEAHNPPPADQDYGKALMEFEVVMG